MGPKRLWTGDWNAQSAAARARMAERRGLIAPDPEPMPDPVGVAEAVPSRSWGELVRAALARLGASARALAAELRRPGGVRVRLAFIALIAAAAGAGTVIGIQASSSSSGAARSTTATGGAWLGVDLGNALGPAGALVEFVVPGSPADQGGIELGDVITAIDGRAVGNPQAASSAIAELRPGATALFTIDRFGQPIALRATLGSRASAAP